MYDKHGVSGTAENDTGIHSHDLHGCSCCAAALPELLRTAGIDLARTATDFRSARPPGKSPHLQPHLQPHLFVNARILTMDAAASEAEALLVRDGRIQFVGSAAEASRLAEADTQRIDCQGRTLLPGFIEPHMHLIPIAVLRLYENVGPFRHPTVEGALTRLREGAATLPSGEWVVGRQFDPSLQDGPDALTRELLDGVSTRHPVFVYNASLHLGYCNSLALEIAGIHAGTPNPPGAEFGRAANGEPNGVLKGGPAMGAVARHNAAMRSHDVTQACLDVFRHANSVGFTTLCDQGTGLMQGGSEVSLYQALRDSEAMTCRFRYSLGDARADDWDRTTLAFGQGDEWLRATGWKIVSDGSNQGLTGLQREPFLRADHCGIAYVEPQDLEDKVRRRLAEGWQVVVHANGDRAIDNALAAYAAARDAGLDPGERRCRIEHCSILHDEQIEAIRDLGLSPSFLIGHVYWWGQAFRDEIFGADKAAKLDRTGACEAAGIRWTLHSDEPVTEMGPLRCIENAVTRALWRDPGAVLAPEECVSVDAALRAMTRDAAWQCHSEHEIGSLEPGKLADFVILEQDPRAVAPSAIGSIRVLETWVNGSRVHSADADPDGTAP
ncbi:MAG: amidohydrolase family protein [Pseudomonadales bacterium]